MATIVGIKFKHTGKIYYFDPEGKNYRKGSGVIVETARGVEYGTVALEKKEVEDDKIVQPLKPILRPANADDEAKVKRNEERVPEALRIATEKSVARGLEMKFIDAEYTFDGSKIILYFTAANRIDFRELVKDMAAALHNRIELRQIGIRDETRLIGGIAPCGRICCCAAGVSDFKKSSIKMAKTQGLSLNPSKISGLCGRLMCCLEFENNHYSETFKKMPKVGSEVITPDGKATVVSNNMLKMLVKTKFEASDGSLSYKDYNLEDIKVKKTNDISDIDDVAEDTEIKELLGD